MSAGAEHERRHERTQADSIRGDVWFALKVIPPHVHGASREIGEGSPASHHEQSCDPVVCLECQLSDVLMGAL